MKPPARQGLSTGQSHQLVFTGIRWVGVQMRLDTEEEQEFREFLPLRPRGAQVTVDTFDPTAQVTITGRVLSPARKLDPTAAPPQLWIEGQTVKVDDSGKFSTSVALHEGPDQVTFRALDATKLAGRGYVTTYLPL